MKFAYRDQALDDLEWFKSYYPSTFPEGARRASIHLIAAEQSLIDNPFLGRVLANTDKRELPIARTPFSLIHIIRGDELQILRVWDARAHPGRK